MRQRSVTIEGRPVPWSRTATHKGRRITPKKQRAHKELVATLAATQGGIMVGPLMLQVTFCYRRPKRPKHDRPQVRPDIDNLIKQIQDALQGVWYEDDCQVVTVCAMKEYGEKHETHVTVTELG